MAFVAAMNYQMQPKTKLGINGETVYTEEGVGDVRVSLFTMLTRGLEESYIANAIAKAPDAYLEDLCVMAFQLRDIRGGKGERDLFYTMMRCLAKRNPELTKHLVKLIPEYGCWRDLWELYDVPELKEAIEWATVETWVSDGLQEKPKSLLAKWIPRETSKTYPGLARRFANLLFSHIPPRSRMAEYRKAVATRNRKLKTTEINMCGKTWADITPDHVPGRSMKIHNAAFFNLKLDGSGKQKRRITQTQRSSDPDRIACKEHFVDFLAKVRGGKATAKGANVVYPHEIVSTIRYQEKEAADLLEAQWVSIREGVAKQGGLGKVVPMCDFSGSMSGTPIDVSLALGILISEIAAPAFRDHILTFDSTPKWHSFVGKTTLKEKIRSTEGCGQGLSTDFYKACQLIIRKMEEARVPIGEEPEDLIVLTDMGWDAAKQSGDRRYGGYSTNTDSWSTQLAKIRQEFKEASARVWVSGSGNGAGWKVPRIIIWNLRAEYKDFHATASDEGVLMISGWSPNILKVLQKGGVDCITPYAGMRAILDDERYNPVREAYRNTV